MYYINLFTGEKLEECDFLAYLQAKEFDCCNYDAVWITENNSEGKNEYQWLVYFEANPPACGSSPVCTVPPSITGNNYVGQVLSTTNGDWVGTAPITFTYEWKRVGQDVAIGTESTYTITSLDADEYITCTVTATNDFGSGSSVSNQVLVSINWGLGCATNWGASTNAVWGV